MFTSRSICEIYRELFCERGGWKDSVLGRGENGTIAEPIDEVENGIVI